MSMTTIKNDQLTVTISTMGAEIQSILDRNGLERLWQGDPSVWKGRAPILFPVAGGMKDDGYELDGQWHSMPKHGFAKLMEWVVESAETDKATLMLDKPYEGFPFKYQLRAVFTLTGSALKVDYTVTNADDKVFWYSVGAHEAYAAPGAIEDYQLVFDQQETLDQYPLVGNLISRETVRLGENTNVLPLNYELLAHDALVFRNLKSTGVTLRSLKHDRTVHVDYPGNRTIMFWHAPKGEYLCIEPWNNSPDFLDAPADIAKKPDFIRLEPSKSETRTHTIVIG